MESTGNGAFTWKIEKFVKHSKYVYAKVLNYPNAEPASGMVMAHRIIIENHIGRLLDSDEVVHHLDGDTKNNNVDNLIVLSRSDHAKLHRLEHGRKFVELKCPWCEIIFHIPRNQSFLNKGYEFTACSRTCRGKISRSVQLNRETSKLKRTISENLVREYTYFRDNSEQTANNGMRRGHTSSI